MRCIVCHFSRQCQRVYTHVVCVMQIQAWLQQDTTQVSLITCLQQFSVYLHGFVLSILALLFIIEVNGTTLIKFSQPQLAPALFIVL